MGPYQRTPKEVAIDLLDSHVFCGPFSGSCWRFLGNIVLTGWKPPTIGVHRDSPRVETSCMCVKTRGEAMDAMKAMRRFVSSFVWRGGIDVP